MLQMMELVDAEKVRLYEDQFEKHDADGSGKLTKEDLEYIHKQMKYGEDDVIVSVKVTS